MTLGNGDQQKVQQAVQSGGHVDTNGMNAQRAQEIRAEEQRLRDQLHSKS